MDLLQKFESHLKQSQLIFPGEKILVACSGGPDSVALFYLLVCIQKKWNLRLGLLHLNHRFRGRASNGDERFVAGLAKKYRVPVYSERRNIRAFAKKEKYSEEEAARLARYEFFSRRARKYKIKKIVTAHTQDDQAETVLMRLFQGTGLRGLCGIREILQQGQVKLVRPLLSFSKKEILVYLKQNQISFRDDRTNHSVRYLRNRIRLKLIPWLEKEINPQVQRALARVPESLREEAGVLAQMEEAAWRRVFLGKKGRAIILSRKRFENYPAPLQFRILERGLKKLDAKSGLGFEAWQRLRPHLKLTVTRQSLPKDIDLSLTLSKLMLCKRVWRRGPIETFGK